MRKVAKTVTLKEGKASQGKAKPKNRSKSKVTLKGDVIKPVLFKVPCHDPGNKSQIMKPNGWNRPEATYDRLLKQLKRQNRGRKIKLLDCLRIKLDDEIVVMDIDSGTPISDQHRILSALEPYGVVERSRSGNGYHIFIRVADKANLLRCYDRTEDHKEKYKLKGIYAGELVFVTAKWVDKKLSGWEPIENLKPVDAATINKVLEPWRKEESNFEYTPSGGDIDLDELEDCVAQLEADKIDITAGYERWISIGFALMHELGEAGRSYYHRISRLNSEYNKGECDAKYSSFFLTKTSRPKTKGTLFKYFQEAGVEDGAPKISNGKKDGGNHPKPSKQAAERARKIQQILECVEDDLDAPADKIWMDMIRDGEDTERGLIVSIQKALRSGVMDENVLEGITPFEPEEDEIIMYYDEQEVMSRGNHSLIQGKKKARKTLLYLLFLSLMDKELKVGVFDTEQGNRRVWRLQERTRDFIPGMQIDFYNLKNKQFETRKRIIFDRCKEHKYDVIVIDGIRDLVSDFNDIAEVAEIIYWIEKLIALNNAHVVNILHQNKGIKDLNSRGHLGTELENKCESVIMCEKDEKSGNTTVSNPFPREIAFESFLLTHHPITKYPQVLGPPPKKETKTEKTLAELTKRVTPILLNQALKYTALAVAMKEAAGVTIGTAKKHISILTKAGVIKSKSDFYSLV